MAMEKNLQIERNVGNRAWMLILWVKRKWTQFSELSDRTKLFLIVKDDTASSKCL